MSQPGARSAQPSPAKKHGTRAAVAALAACAAWALLVRPLEHKAAAQHALLANSQREVEQFEDGSQTVADLAPAIDSMRKQLVTVYSRAAISGDSGRLYDALRRLATSTSVRIERIEPSTARQAAHSGQHQPREVIAETSGYTVEVTGTYAAVADFINACENQLGASRVTTFRMASSAPTPDGQTPIVSAVVETVHLRLSPPESAAPNQPPPPPAPRNGGK